MAPPAATEPPLLRAWRAQQEDGWDRKKVGHLLRRSGFAPRRADIDRARSGTIAGAIESIFTPTATPGDQALDAIEATVLKSRDTDAYAAWWAQRMLQTGDPLRERCALMWHGHFATSDAKVESPTLMARQCALFRDKGLGDIRELARAITRDCAMLRFLDGNRNRKDSPNENFAREIFELFLLGIGNYTERDVKDAARAFTGYREENGRFRFRKDLHDDGDKTVFGHSGPLTGDQIIDLCFARDECATFLARRLRQTFLTSAMDPKDDVDELDRLLGVELRAADFHVGRFLKRLFASELFFAERFYRAIIKSPVEYAVGAARALEIRVPGKKLCTAIADMGQRLFVPPGVQGWSGGVAWLSSARMVARNLFATTVAESVPKKMKQRITGDWLVALLLDNNTTPEVRRSLNHRETPFASRVHVALMLPEFQVS